MKDETILVNARSLMGFTVGGEEKTLEEMLQFYKDTNILLYNTEDCEAPVVVDKYSKIKLIDAKDLSQERIDEIFNKQK